ncbi:hypothetical protein GMOD_00009555 [Pyrenophora seminiperda CCB06]|uniref:Uncharacterized protein n=1 Tax=Pyrenophora seminiperda CCB06 TaxID=1302712 RepID=A0A3M7MES6_9PLEO|nr:hypothetical protein GMOD_00009555 [Pyrenophora seminiperda CCB06]
MTTFLNSPCSPKPVHDTFYDDQHSIRDTSRHTANLSGATMLDLLSGPEGTLAAAYNESETTPTKVTSKSKSKRPSNASTTKAQLRQTNRTLLEIIQTIQAELAYQREAMLDMQTRIYHLETRPCVHNSNNDIETPPKLPPRKRPEVRSKPAKNPSRETPRRRDAHQKSSEKRSTSKNKEGAFWKSPTRFSGFNFNFDLLETVPNSKDAREVHQVSPPIHEKDDEHSDPFTSGKRKTAAPRIARVLTGEPTAMYHDVVSDIREHVIDFDRVRTPVPPKLQTPPRSSRSKLNTSHSRDDEITALPQVPALPSSSFLEDPTPSHHRKRIKSLFMSRTFSKSYNKADFAPHTGGGGGGGADHHRRSGSLRC